MKKQLYEIAIEGCDDSTIWLQELTENESEFLQSICKMAEETSEYGCMPTMRISVVESITPDRKEVKNEK